MCLPDASVRRNWLAFGRPSLRTPCDAAMPLLLLMAGVTTQITIWPELTYPQVYRLLVGIGLFYAVVNWTSSRLRLRIIFYGICFAGLVLALSAPLSTAGRIGTLYTGLPFTADPRYVRLLALTANTSNENVLAGALVLVLAPALALLLFAPRRFGWFGSLLALVSAAAMTGILALSDSRGAILALAVALVGLLMLRWRWSRYLVPVACSSRLSQATCSLGAACSAGCRRCPCRRATTGASSSGRARSI